MVSESSSSQTPECTDGNWFNGIGKAKTAKTAALTVYSARKEPLTLTPAGVKASGGEGTVYALPQKGKDHVLVKIYRESVLQDPRELRILRGRLSDMLHLAELGKQPWIAWPRAGVFNRNGEVIGFAMNRCSGPSFLALSGGPASVEKTFHGWDRTHLVRTGIDFLKKLEFLAAYDVLVNDFNPANFLVSRQSEVSFIDCDSYQIPKRGKGVHITHTYFPLHVAPEFLKDKNLLTCPRSVHQVEFEAAVTVFMLQMYGLSPYTYYEPSHRSACGTPDENLLQGRCPLEIGAGCLFPAGGWYYLWSWLSGSLKAALIQTFREGHGNPEKRVSLAQLREELEKMLFLMEKDPQHRTLSPENPTPRGDKTSGRASAQGKEILHEFLIPSGKSVIQCLI